MMIIGCDYHPRYQQIAMMDTETGELVERRLEHENGEARAFYASLPKPARVGMEATGYGQWFERMLGEQGHELWIGHASEIRAGVVQKQKTDARDAAHLLRLLAENRFPRIWIPSPAERDTRQLLRHRYKLVCFRVSVKNQLHGLAMSQGVCRKKKLFTAKGREELEKLSLGPWASRRRQELLGMLDQLNPVIDELDRAVQQEAEIRADAVRLMTHPGVGPVTASDGYMRLSSHEPGRNRGRRPCADFIRGARPKPKSKSNSFTPFGLIHCSSVGGDTMILSYANRALDLTWTLM
jgi:transposase